MPRARPARLFGILGRLQTSQPAGLTEHDKPRPLRGLLVFDAPAGAPA